VRYTIDKNVAADLSDGELPSGDANPEGIRVAALVKKDHLAPCQNRAVFL